jgi:hypothetical protein
MCETACQRSLRMDRIKRVLEERVRDTRQRNAQNRHSVFVILYFSFLLLLIINWRFPPPYSTTFVRFRDECAAVGSLSHSIRLFFTFIYDTFWSA